MKKIKKVMLLLASFVIACCLGGALISANASSSPEAIFSEIDIQEVYITNELFEAPDVSVTINGKEYKTECTIIFPDGRTCYSDMFVLDQVGVYTVTYSAVVDRKTYSETKQFTVKHNSESLLTVEKAEVKYGLADFSEEVYGAQINAEVGAKVTYNKVIDLSANTKEDVLIDLVALANKPQTEDFSAFYITLTDIYDESNYISIKVHSAKANHWYCSYVQVKAPGQRYCGLEGGNPNFGINAGGYVVWHSFGSFFPEVESNTGHSVQLTYDNDEKAIYAKSGVDDLFNKVLDLDDESYITKLWGGFTTGEVKLTVTLGDISGTPKFLIKSIDGNEFLSEEPVDNRAPALFCDIPNNVPNAVVGKYYTLFKANAFDNYGLDNFTQKVYYRYGTGNETSVGVIEGAFTPKKAGIYTIVYEAIDLSGNSTKKTVEVEAKENTDIEALTISLDSTESESKEIGEIILLREYETVGGVGFNKVDITVEKNGEVVLKATEESFSVYEAGEYDVVYTVKDYVGNESSIRYSLTISANTKPLILDDIVLPSAFINALSYKLPLTKAYDYSSGAEILVEPTITAKIGDKELPVTNGVIVPSVSNSGDCVKISYKYRNALGKETEYTREIPVIIAKNDTGAIAQTKYFFTTGFEVESLSDSIIMNTTQVGASATYIRPLQAHNLMLSIGISNTNFACDYLDVTLSDKYVAGQVVVLRIYKNGTVSVNGEEAVDIHVDRTDARTIFTFSYNNNTRALSDSNEKTIAKIKTNANGKPFDGFDSGEVFVNLKAGNVTGETVVYFMLLNNQLLSKSGRDNITPQMFINDLVGGSYKIGDEVTIYRAFAYDVLSDISSFTVTIRNLDTNNVLKDINGLELSSVSAEEEYVIKLENYGRYQVQYTSKDSAGKSFTVTKLINVFDDEPPTITIEGKIPTTGKVNQTITMPKAAASDRQGEITSSYMIAIAPDGKRTYFVSQFTPDQTGVWYVQYFAMDSNGQIALVEYAITIA